MIFLVVGLGLLISRFYLMTRVLSVIARFHELHWDWLFLVTLSLDRNAQRVYLISLLNRTLEGLIVLCLIGGVSTLIGGELRWLWLVASFIISFLITRLLGKMKHNQTILLKRLQNFLYFYEMELMKGTHQFLALREADRRTQIFGHLEHVTAYIEATNQLYVHVRWLVVKKMSILLERNQTFSNQDLTGDFVQLAQELHQRFAQGERLRLERRENLMMVPMMLNMILMMLYLIAPFLKDFFV